MHNTNWKKMEIFLCKVKIDKKCAHKKILKTKKLPFFIGVFNFEGQDLNLHMPFPILAYPF